MTTADRPSTPEEYLANERAAEWKSEFVAGELRELPHPSEAHALIAWNIASALHVAFTGKPCRAFVSDMRVRVSETGLYTYPDIAVACGELEFLDEKQDTLLNPLVLFEVLSPSTERYDRGARFANYQQLASLREYVLVAQDQMRVERYLRQGEDWLLSVSSGPEAVLHLPSLECSLPLSGIYQRVELPAEPEAGRS